MRSSVVAEELVLLERVTKLLAELPEPQTPAEGPLVRELQRLREEIISRRESKDAMALHEQWHRQNALLQQLRVSRDTPQVDPRCPYFGRMRLREEDAEQDICLGRATCIEGGVRIVDWRNAPVSRLFYCYEQGDEYEEEIAERLRLGRVVVRRTMDIRDGVLERVEAPEGVFIADAEAPGGWLHVEPQAARLAGGEGSALRAYAGGEGASRRLETDLRGARWSADKRLPEITGLLDPAQFELITRPGPGFLVIRGAAGSGKTTVALHRIAYLAYDEPEVDSGRTLFVVFSPALRSYVGHVLPGLGVERVAVRTYHEWAARQRRRHFPRLPGKQRDDAPALVQRMKLHPLASAALAEQVQRVPGAASAEQALDDWASMLTQKGLLEEICARDDAPAFSASEIERVVDWNRRQNEDLFQWIEGDSEIQAALDPEDDALLLRAWQLRVGPLRAGGRKPLRYRHVAIDEVQDFSPVEVQVLLDCLDRERSITLAGDTQQHVMEQSGFTSWSEFFGHLGVSGTEVETLRISYRSSREIADFARSVLGDLCEEGEPPVTTRTGPPVEFFRFTDRGACVAFLTEAFRQLAEEEPLASVAVLTPSPEFSQLYYDGLATGDVPRLRRVANQNFTFAPGIEITEIEQVKGLEFDYVVVVDASEEHFPDSPPSRRLLYVAATRAVHQLWLTCVGTPSSLLDGISG